MTFSNFGSFLLIFAPFCRFSEIAGHFPHGGGPPGAGDDFDVMTLPPKVRPFIPERYAPPAHVLSQAVFRHFTDFNERAPGDLLLREPKYHLSHEAREVFTSFLPFLQRILHFSCILFAF